MLNSWKYIKKILLSCNSENTLRGIPYAPRTLSLSLVIPFPPYLSLDSMIRVLYLKRLKGNICFGWVKFSQSYFLCLHTLINNNPQSLVYQRRTEPIVILQCDTAKSLWSSLQLQFLLNSFSIPINT